MSYPTGSTEPTGIKNFVNKISTGFENVSTGFKKLFTKKSGSPYSTGGRKRRSSRRKTMRKHMNGGYSPNTSGNMYSSTPQSYSGGKSRKSRKTRRRM